MLSSRYQRKRTSDVDKRACFVCYKPTNVVLLNENPQMDFFYTCESHLLDRGFAKPDTPPPAQVRLDKEINDLKKEWDNVRPLFKPPLPPKPGQEQDDQANDTDSQKDTESTSSTSKPSEQVQNSIEISGSVKKPDPLPQWYMIDPRIHQLRVQHKARVIKQKKTAQLLRSPLPQVPAHPPK